MGYDIALRMISLRQLCAPRVTQSLKIPAWTEFPKAFRSDDFVSADDAANAASPNGPWSMKRKNPAAAASGMDGTLAKASSSLITISTIRTGARLVSLLAHLNCPCQALSSTKLKLWSIRKRIVPLASVLKPAKPRSFSLS
eukprot:4324673-Amphidinium_carterae.1